jgi:hypothetical protein
MKSRRVTFQLHIKVFIAAKVFSSSVVIGVDFDRRYISHMEAFVRVTVRLLILERPVECNMLWLGVMPFEHDDDRWLHALNIDFTHVRYSGG